MNPNKYLSECHNVEATYFSCEDWGAFLCSKCGEKCKADEVKTTVECGFLIHAADGSICANPKPCFLHDLGENKKWRERSGFELDNGTVGISANTHYPKPKDDIDTMVRDFCAIGTNVKSEVRRRIEDYGKAQQEKGKAYWEPSEYHKEIWRKEGYTQGREKGEQIADWNGEKLKDAYESGKKVGYTKGIEDSIKSVKGQPCKEECQLLKNRIIAALEALKNK